MKTRVPGGLAAAVAMLALLSCEVSRTSGPNDVQPQRSSLLGSGAPKKLSCPTNDTQTATADVGPLGGVISAGGTSISVPAGALLNTVTMTVTVPRSNYMEV